MTNLAIIPARGGSKGIPNKNLALICGQPMIGYSIRAAIESKIFDRIVVSTDSEAIAKCSQEAGAEVIRRPAELAGDSSLLWGAINHALDSLKPWSPERCVILQPTSPLRTAEHIRESFLAWEKSQAVSVVSVVPTHQHPNKSVKIVGGMLEPLTKIEDLSKPRQELPEVYMQNGAIYGVLTEAYRRQQALLIQPALPYIMRAEDSVDVDNPIDLVVCAALLRDKNQP